MSQYRIVEYKFKYKETHYTVEKVTYDYPSNFWWKAKEKWVTVKKCVGIRVYVDVTFKSEEEAKQYILELEDKPIKTIIK